MIARRKTAGFTLIEILVVMIIISIVAGVTLVSINFNQRKELKTFADQFAQLLSLAQEQAMLQSKVLGLSIKETSFQFLSYKEATGIEKARWLPIDDRMLGRQAIPTGIFVDVRVEGRRVTTDVEEENNEDEEKTFLPQIVISTSGDMTPFTVYIGKRDASPQFAIKGKTNGEITVERLD